MTALSLAFLAFIGLGLPDGLLGVAWPSIRSTFGLPLDALGGLLIPFTASYVASSFASGAILARMTVGSLLALSCLATGVSLLGYAVAPVWMAMVALAALAGIGAGAIDAGVNAYVAANHGPRTLNWMHAAYGLGAASGPILMTAVLTSGRGWRSGYALVAAGQLVLAAGFAASRSLWPSPRTGEAGRALASIGSSLSRPAVWLGIAAFFVYTGLEAVAGVWAYSFLTSIRGLSMTAAGLGVTMFWASLTIGRVLFGALVETDTVSILLRGALAVILVAALILWMSSSAFVSVVALGVVGLACGPVFPSLMSQTPARVGIAHGANAVGFQVAAAAFGQSLLPTLVGRFARTSDLEVVPISILVAAVALFALHERIVALNRGATPARAASAAPGARGATEL